MAAIQSLLNPLPEAEAPAHQLPSPCSTVYTRDFSPQLPARKKQKISKDAAVFTRGSIRGECRYPPSEHQDELLAAYHQQYEIHPIGHIAEFPRHIPYNSEKKSFLERTGRESFEVFQYEFTVPGDEKVYCMMWDYNIGLVRTTPLFRCNGYSKTTPAKMLNRNPGLREICHSITGGALVAQGYWMPFEAAKAVAATFCYNIRYALTPIFGPEFPASCIPPESEKFGEMVIDPAITQRCTEEARAYRLMEARVSSRASSLVRRSPITPAESPSFPVRYIKQLRPNKAFSRIADGRNGYSTDSSHEDNYSLGPSTPPHAAYHNHNHNGWTPANTPRSIAEYHTRLPSPQEILSSIPTNRYGNQHEALLDSSSESSSPSLPSPPRRTTQDADEDYDGGSSDESSCDESVERRTRGERPTSPDARSDEKAAYLLMSLRMQKADLSPRLLQQSRKRRASA